jgi:membrane associated rhomboid family serine protease
MNQKVTLQNLLPSLVFVALIVFVKLAENYLGYKGIKLGVFPRTLEGLLGIITAPFIHGDWKHLFNNALPLIVLGTSLRFFYKEISKEVFFWSWLMSGLWLWSIGRPSFHIGASGLVYALASFLFFSGLIRKHTRLMAVSLVVVFLYGSLIWGIFPIKTHISWEGHLSGGIAGVLLAWWFREQGPPTQKYQYEIEEELEEKAVKIEFHYKEN